ncbi:MAG TPA: hypothetical protein VIS06_21480, partial [Mycobacteriales bacterium]
MTGNGAFAARWPQSVEGTNVAAGNSYVDTQIGYVNRQTIVHVDRHTYVSRDDSPAETFRIARNHLAGGGPQYAEELIAGAVARDPDFFSPEVAYHWALAMLSGRSIEDLDDDRFKTLWSCFHRAREHTRDQWRDALDVVEKLLGCLEAQEEHDGRFDQVRFDRASTCLARLPGERQEEIARHLQTLLAGAGEDRADAVLQAQVIEHRMGRDRMRRVPKFFEPVPAAPRKRVITRAPCDREIALSIVGAAVGIFGAALALVTMVAASPAWTVAVVVLCGGGGIVLVWYGREYRYLDRRRTERQQAISGSDAVSRTASPVGAGSERFATRIKEFV